MLRRRWMIGAAFEECDMGRRRLLKVVAFLVLSVMWSCTSAVVEVTREVEMVVVEREVVEIPVLVTVEVEVSREVEVTREVVVTATVTAVPTATATVAPTATALPSATAVATSTASPTPVVTLPALPSPTLTPSPTATGAVTPVPTSRVAAVSVITPVPGLAEKLRAAMVGKGASGKGARCDVHMHSDGALDQMAEWMLDRVNEVRDENGLAAVVLDGNASAQAYASTMLADLYSSRDRIAHVDRWGRDPYDRWLDRGGSLVRDLGENLWTVWGDIKTCEVDLRAWVLAAVRDWMGSDGHRRNLLDPSFEAVSLGFAWDTWEIYMVQVFVDY